MKALYRQEGFYLMEVILALGLFALVSAVFLSGWQYVAELKEESLMYSYALDMAHNELERFFSLWAVPEISERNVHMGGYEYRVSWLVADEGALERGMVEIQWQLSNGKRQKLRFVLYRDKTALP